jgi:hypothetical protein
METDPDTLSHEALLQAMEEAQQTEWESASRQLEGVRDALKGYDLKSLASACGGLQLYPPNAHRLVRFQALATTIAAIPHAELGGHQISPARLRQLLKGAPLGEGFIKYQEDPFAGQYVEEAACFGGAYLVIGGATDHDVFTFQTMLDAIRDGIDECPVKNLPTFALAVAQAVLTISDIACKRARLTRGTMAPEDISGDPVPSSQNLKRLCEAVQFDMHELSNLLEKQSLNADLLKQFTSLPGEIPLSGFQLSNSAVHYHPLLLVDNTLIILSPPLLLHALRCWILTLFQREKAIDWLNERFHEMTLRSVRQSLSRIGYRFDRDFESVPAICETISRVSPASVDRAKNFVFVLTEDLRDFDVNEPFKAWGGENLSNKLFKELAAIDLANAAERTFIVVVLQNSTQAIFLTSDSDLPNSLALFASAAGLDLISLLSGSDSTTLPKFAKVRKAAFSRREYQAWGFEEEFGCYLKYEESFYLSDEVSRDTSISLSVGFANKLHELVVMKSDPRIVPYPSGKGYGKVVLAHGSRSIPLYTQASLRPNKAALYLNGSALDWWLIPDRDNPETDGISFQFAELLGFWFWKCDAGIAAAVKGVLNKDAWVVKVKCDPGGDWSRASSDVVSVFSITSVVDVAARALEISIPADILWALSSQDNAGERELVQQVLTAFLQSISVQNAHATAQKIVFDHVPIGRMKRISVVQRPVLGAGFRSGLPRLRQVSQADVGLILDDLGDYLDDTHKMGIGPIPDQSRCSVLKEVVGWLYAQLKAKVASLSPRGLLESLIAFNEALAAAREERSIHDPPRVACFGSNVIDIIHEEVQRENAASVASRFLIEYIAASPPSGSEIVSIDAYDHLLALAHLIYTFGVQSDLIHFGLGDIKMSILNSRRLGSKKSTFEAARDKYVSAMEGKRRLSLEKNYDEIWQNKPSETAKTRPSEADDWDRAARAEFGFSLTDILNCLSECALAASQTSRGIAVAPKIEITQRIAKEIHVDVATAEGLISLLSLGTRPDFLKPPAPHTKNDVVPWRYNRALSYLRRPLIIRENEVLLGLGGLVHARDYLIAICSGGRLKANSDAMKHMISQAQNRQSKAFEQAVCTRLGREEGLKANTFAKFRLRPAFGFGLPDFLIGIVADRAAGGLDHGGRL